MNNANISSPTISTPLASKKVATYLKWSSCTFATVGGILIASKTDASGIGFIFLAASSAQMLASSLMTGDKSLACYSGSLFLFVDCLGIYRWLLQ